MFHKNENVVPYWTKEILKFINFLGKVTSVLFWLASAQPTSHQGKRVCIHHRIKQRRQYRKPFALI